jgi:two-component system, sensor histidine kinase and response regulator
MEKSKVIQTVSDPSGVRESGHVSEFDGAAFEPTLEDLLEQYAHIDETREALGRYGAELSRLAEETARASAEAQARVERTRDFLLSATRDLRASLIRAFEASAALHKESACGTELAEVIYRETASSLSLVEDLDQLSRLEMNTLEDCSTEFDLTPVLESALEQAQPLAEAKGLKLEFKRDAKLPARIVGHSEKLGEVLKRLLLNSINTAEAGTVELEAEVLSSTAEGSRLRFFVNDEGPGYSEEQLIGLFQPAEGGGESSGHTNLRLAICKRLAEAMGGVLGVNSAKGEGSSYWLFLKAPCC